MVIQYPFWNMKNWHHLWIVCRSSRLKNGFKKMSTVTAGSLSALRVLRVLRVARILRLLRFFRPLWLLVIGAGSWHCVDVFFERTVGEKYIFLNCSSVRKRTVARNGRGNLLLGLFDAQPSSGFLDHEWWLSSSEDNSLESITCTMYLQCCGSFGDNIAL